MFGSLKRLLSERVVKFFVWSIHEKRLFLCRVTSAFDQYAYYEKREETKISRLRINHELLNFMNSMVRQAILTNSFYTIYVLAFYCQRCIESFLCILCMNEH